MIHNRPLTVYTTNTRRANVYQSAPQDIGQFFERLRSSQAIPFSHDSYMALSKGQQDDLKDVGGFVLGELRGGRRKAGAVLSRCAAVLDADNLGPGETENAVRRVEALGCGYCIYSTAKHSQGAPRLRIVIPFSEDIPADEHEPVTRLLCQMIQPEMTWFDPTTAEPSRMMYYPAHCQDIAPVYYAGDKPLLDARVLLSRLQDWQDVTSWPRFPQEQTPARLAAKQGDPETKHGVVGAFCRVYDVPAAMDKFLPGVYEETDTPGRYTFTGGSTTGGAVLYDGGKFLYSHHATDPCGGKLVNAFDLVRLHCFGDKDDEAQPGTPINRLPSYNAMCELAAGDSEVSGLLLRERWAEATEGFTEAVGETQDDSSWIQRLKTHSKTGKPLSTIDNVWIILENDPLLKGRFALNAFAGRGEVLGPVPWSESTERRLWSDNDNQGLYWYLEKYYQITGTGKIDGALSLHSEKHAFNEITAYLEGLVWDGAPRLDTLFIDYLGAEDTPYTRAVTRKAFTAAVTRAMVPGAKFDNMTILSGPQGIGKSTLLDKMSRGWFNDSIRTFEGKEASELLQGVWLVEISELDAFRRTDVSRIKQFLSQRADRFRAAYGRHVKEMPRRCVFFGTTNTGDYLQDKTGNRRFWPVDVGLRPPVKSVWNDLDNELDQLWAEAVVRWRTGEPLYLAGDLAEAAKAQQEDHREVSAREGLILDFLDRPVPRGWPSWDLNRRRVYWAGGVSGEMELAPRDRVCALEVWCELLDGQKRDMRYSDTQEINSIIAAAPGWKRKKTALKFGYCGAQKGFVRG